jgi:transposase
MAAGRRRWNLLQIYVNLFAPRIRYRGGMNAQPSLAGLPHDVQAYIRELEARNRQLSERVHYLEEQFRLAQLKRFAPSSEKRRDRVFNEAEQDAAANPDAVSMELPDTGLPSVPEPAKKQRGRKPLPADLPRQRIEYDLPEEQKVCPCCQGTMHRIGEDVTEQLHIPPAKPWVWQHVRFKYGCRHCERHELSAPVIRAAMPPQPLPGSVADAATIATVMTGKYADGIPLYRMEAVLGRSGIDLCRGTLGHWIIGASQRHLQRLVDAMQRVLLSQPLIHGDETTVQVLHEEGKSAESTSYMWVYRSAEGSAEPVVLFDYQPGRGQEYPQAFLRGYRGKLVTDGYQAWRTLKGATHFGCIAHMRRKFDEAAKVQKTDSRAKQALAFIGRLYQVEAIAKGELPAGQTRAGYTHALRQQHSVPMLAAFKAWLDEQAGRVLPKCKLGEAVAYARNQWSYLIRYVDDGAVPIDNNLLERDIRPFATGRKNWLFSDTVGGAQASAVIYSLMLTCRACGVEPWTYLHAVLTELPRRSDGADISDLLPWRFAQQQTPAASSSST